MSKTVEEIRALKYEAEQVIYSALVNFKTKTGLAIMEVEVRLVAAQSIGGERESYFVESVTLKTESI